MASETELDSTPLPQWWIDTRDQSKVLPPDPSPVFPVTEEPEAKPVPDALKPRVRNGSRNSLRETNPVAWEAIRAARRSRRNERRNEQRRQAALAREAKAESLPDVTELELAQARLNAQAERLQNPEQPSVKPEIEPIDPAKALADMIASHERNVEAARNALLKLQENGADDGAIRRGKNHLTRLEAALEDLLDPTAKQRRKVAELEDKIARAADTIRDLQAHKHDPAFIARRQASLDRMREQLADMKDPTAKPQRKLEKCTHQIAAHEAQLAAVDMKQKENAVELNSVQDTLAQLRGDHKKMVKGFPGYEEEEHARLSQQIAKHEEKETLLKTARQRLIADKRRLTSELSTLKYDQKKLLGTLPEPEKAEAPVPVAAKEKAPKVHLTPLAYLAEKRGGLQSKLAAAEAKLAAATAPDRDPEVIYPPKRRLEGAIDQVKAELDKTEAMLAKTLLDEETSMARRTKREAERASLTRAHPHRDPQRRVSKTLANILMRREELAEKAAYVKGELPRTLVAQAVQELMDPDAPSSISVEKPMATLAPTVAGEPDFRPPMERRWKTEPVPAFEPDPTIAEIPKTKVAQVKRVRTRNPAKVEAEPAPPVAISEEQAEAAKLAAQEAELQRFLEARRAAQAALPDTGVTNWGQYVAEHTDDRPGYRRRT